VGIGPIVSDFVFAIGRATEAKVLPGSADALDCDLTDFIGNVLSCECLEFVVDVRYQGIVNAKDVTTSGQLLVEEDRRLFDDKRTCGLQEGIQGSMGRPDV
jgi:hypothetical protein